MTSLPLIEVDASDSLVLCKTTVDRLRDLDLEAAPAPILVVASVGARNVGKSTLLNRVIGQQVFTDNRSGNSAGSSVLVNVSLTMHTLAATPPAVAGRRVQLVVLDAKGFEEETKGSESKLLALLAIVSDLMLWSVDARIEQRDLDKMSAFGALLDATVAMPRIALLVRNSQLVHNGEPAQYFREVLMKHANARQTNDGAIARANLAKSIQTRFDVRDTIYLPWPVDDERTRVRVNELRDEELKPLFLSRVRAVRDEALATQHRSAFFGSIESMMMFLKHAIALINRDSKHGVITTSALLTRQIDTRAVDVAQCVSIANTLRGLYVDRVAVAVDPVLAHAGAVKAARLECARILAGHKDQQLQAVVNAMLDVHLADDNSDLVRLLHQKRAREAVGVVIRRVIAQFDRAISGTSSTNDDDADSSDDDDDGGDELLRDFAVPVDTMVRVVRENALQLRKRTEALQTHAKELATLRESLMRESKEKTVAQQQQLDTDRLKLSLENELSKSKAMLDKGTQALQLVTRELQERDACITNLQQQLERAKTLHTAALNELALLRQNHAGELSQLRQSHSSDVALANERITRQNAYIESMQRDLASAQVRANAAESRSRRGFAQNCGHTYDACLDGRCKHDCCKR
jgi:hypothetical protein